MERDVEYRFLDVEEDMRKFKLEVTEVFLAHRNALNAIAKEMMIDISKGNLIAGAEDLVNDR